MRKVVLASALVVDVLLLVDLVAGLLVSPWPLWLVLHLLCCFTVGALHIPAAKFDTSSADSARSGAFTNSPIFNVLDACKQCLPKGLRSFDNGLFVITFLFSLFIPGVGGLGITLAVMFVIARGSAGAQALYSWQITRVVDLPFNSPQDRDAKVPDSRGFTEHLLFSSEDEDIYRKVLASDNMKGALTIDTLYLATQHKNERIRDAAQRILDKKVAQLNQTIAKLELALDCVEPDQLSDTWLQIANNYWKLLTLNRGESVANTELLNKAGTAALKATSVSPSNCNAHYILARVSLAQGDMKAAKVAFEKALSSGMPADRVIPYLAECAFAEQDYPGVENLLSRLDKSIVAYPPLSHVARFWT